MSTPADRASYKVLSDTHRLPPRLSTLDFPHLCWSWWFSWWSGPNHPELLVTLPSFVKP